MARREVPWPVFEQGRILAISIYKGWGFIIVTASLLYWLIRRHTEDVREDEKRLRLVTDGIPALISYMDSNRIYPFSNRVYEDWFGSRADGKKMDEFLGQPVYQTIVDYVNEALSRQNGPLPGRNPIQEWPAFCDATYIPDKGASGVIKGYFALVQDITERRQAEEEIRQWADAFEHCAHGIAIGDPTTNRVVVCNSAFAALHKSRVEDIVRASILSLYAPADHASPAFSASSRPARMWLPMSATRSSRAGSTPRTTLPRTAYPAESRPCALTKGAEASKPRAEGELFPRRPV